MTAYLAGSLLQRRTGLGWRGLRTLPDPADAPSLTVREVHDAFDRLAALEGAGSQQARAAAVADLFGRATAEEQRWLGGLVTGELRQGALDAQVQEALAAAAGVPIAAVRRAAMLAGSTVAIAATAFEGERGAGRDRARGRPAGAADARRERARRRRRGRQGGPGRRTGLGRHQARRDPDPGPPLRRRRRDRHPQPRRHHPPAARGGRAGQVAAGRAVRPRRRGDRARRVRPAAAVPGDRVAHGDGRRGRGHGVLLRPAPPRRPRPARRAGRRSGSRRWRRWCRRRRWCRAS